MPESVVHILKGWLCSPAGFCGPAAGHRQHVQYVEVPATSVFVMQHDKEKEKELNQGGPEMEEYGGT